jgi:hypothetical protein
MESTITETTSTNIMSEKSLNLFDTTSTLAKVSIGSRTTYSTKVTTTKTPKACPSGWKKCSSTNSCYKHFIETSITINQAFSFCPDHQRTSYLADISNEDEFECIQNLIQENFWVDSFMIKILNFKSG